MRKRFPLVSTLILASALAACTAAKSSPAAKAVQPLEPEPVPTVPTVPPEGSGQATPVPLPTRPVENPEAEKEAKKSGKAIGPVVTFAGLARADGKVVPSAATENGIPIFVNYVGSGFIVVVEGKPGISNLEVGRRLTGYDPNDATKRPDLEIELSNPIGDGSKEVCDNRRPNIGGVPAVNPPNFAETKDAAAALYDLACRFETFIEPQSACTLDQTGDFAYAKKDSITQFCMVVAKAWNFPVGDTLVSVRLRDAKGNPGPVSKFVLRRPKERPASQLVKPTPKPTPSRRRP
jgi:hypothetical protein